MFLVFDRFLTFLLLLTLLAISLLLIVLLKLLIKIRVENLVFNIKIREIAILLELLINC